VVYDISAGGNFGAAVPFASGLPGGPYDLVEWDGKILVSTDDGVFEISAGGDFSAASPHAYGRDFSGLAIDAEGRVLASNFDDGDVFEITLSGDYSLVAAFATNFPGLGDTALDTVRGAGTPTPPAQPVPALGTSGRFVLVGMILFIGFVRFASARSTEA
jgi:hypothetical protein